MKHVFHSSPNVYRRVVRDAHAPEQIFVETTTNETEALRKTKRIQNERLLPQDSRSAFADGDVIAFAFNFPTVTDYNLMRRKEPDLMRQALQGTDTERLKAGQKLALLYPQYVMTTTRRDRRRHARQKL